MSKRISTELICIDAEQEICLNGVLWKPDECTSKTAIALFPGTGGEFFDSLFLFLGPARPMMIPLQHQVAPGVHH